MKLLQLDCTSLRNLERVSLRPGERLNFILGSNGEGKTSLLEAIYLLSTLQSFRSHSLGEVVGWGKGETAITGRVAPTAELGALEAKAWECELKVGLFRDDPTDSKKVKKVGLINGKVFKSRLAYLTQRFGEVSLGFHAIVFNPSDHDLVRGEPARRRQYLDRMIGAMDAGYLQALTRYTRVLEQRNALLKSKFYSRDELLSQLQGYTEPLIELGAQITAQRLEHLKDMQLGLENHAKRIAPNQANLTWIYRSSFAPEIDNLCFRNSTLDEVHFSGHPPQASLKQREQSLGQNLVQILTQNLRESLAKLSIEEIRAGSTLAGPHRDDWGFYYGSHPLKGHGSQGEVRTALLALKLAEIDRFEAKTGHQPILLLDDFSSELDSERRSFLLQSLLERRLQVFVTSTELQLEKFKSANDDLSDTRVFELRSGELREI